MTQFPDDEKLREPLWEGPTSFDEVRRRVRVFGVGAFLVFMAILLLGLAQRSLPLMIASVILAGILGLVQYLVIYRCPKCGGYPGRAFWGYPKHCQACGTPLE